MIRDVLFEMIMISVHMLSDTRGEERNVKSNSAGRKKSVWETALGEAGYRGLTKHD